MAAENPKVPIWQTVSDSYRLAFGHFGGLWKAAAIPAALFVALTTIGIYAAVFAGPAREDDPFSNFVVLLAILATIVVFVPFLSQWHRVSILGPERAPPRVEFSFRGREWRFLGYCLLLALIGVMIIILPLSVLAMGMARAGGLVFLIGLGLVLVMLYVFARLSLVLPATAIDRRIGLGESWRRTQGNGVRIAVALFLAELPWRVLSTVSETAIGQTGSLGGFVVHLLVVVFTTIMSIAILASILATAYKTLVGPVDTVEESV